MERPNSPRKLITYSMKGERDNGESIIQDRWLFEIPRVTSRPLAPISIPKKRAYITVVNNGKDSRTRLVSSFYLENRRRPRSIDPSCPRESRILPVWNLGRPPLIELLLFFFFPRESGGIEISWPALERAFLSPSFKKITDRGTGDLIETVLHQKTPWKPIIREICSVRRARKKKEREKKKMIRR